MYNGPDFVKVSVQANAFASGCSPEWEMNSWSQNPDCRQIYIEDMPIYNCYMNQNAPE